MNIVWIFGMNLQGSRRCTSEWGIGKFFQPDRICDDLMCTLNLEQWILTRSFPRTSGNGHRISFAVGIYGVDIKQLEIDFWQIGLFRASESEKMDKQQVIKIFHR